MTFRESSAAKTWTPPVGALVLVGLYLASRYSYLLFHSLVEFFTVIVACGIFVISWNARSIMKNDYFLFVGIASLCVGAVDLVHALAYKGMGVFPDNGSNLPTQLWVSARYLQCVALLVAPFVIGRTLRAGLVMSVFLVATVLLLAAVFGGFFPDCFVDGVGLTPFKKGSEYLFSFMLVGALVFMRSKQEFFDREVVRQLSMAITVLIVSELAFTLYTDVYGISNMAGHFLKFAGFWLIYMALIETGLKRPYNLLFRELKESEERFRQLYIERKEAAEQIEALNADLAQRADQLAESNSGLEIALDQLETVNRELSSANQELEAFNYSVSHDLRSPLTGIYGSSQAILMTCGDRLDSECRELVQQITDSAARMDQLISTLLAFSRLSHCELHRAPVSLSDLATFVAAELRVKEPHRQVSIAIMPGLMANGDSRLLKVVLENLMGNAWKYTGKCEEGTIEFGALPVEGETAFFVRDNGAGFDMAHAGELFTPFQRLHDREEFEGHGIGLATVQRIIQRHGGRIWAEGEPGKGATFWFVLP